MYLIGLCLLEMGDQSAALAQLKRTRSVYSETQEGLAAGLQEADLLLGMHREEDALAVYRMVLGGIQSRQADLRQPLGLAKKVSAPESSRLINTFSKPRKFDEGGALGRADVAPVPASVSAPAWWPKPIASGPEPKSACRNRLPEPQSAGEPAPRTLSHRTAGHNFENLASVEFTQREYPDDVWEGAECYLAGHQFTAAVSLLEEYLKYSERAASAGRPPWSIWASAVWPWAAWTKPWTRSASASNSIRPTPPAMKPDCGPPGP